jgi:hypothetical protein
MARRNFLARASKFRRGQIKDFTAMAIVTPTLPDRRADRYRRFGRWIVRPKL